MAITYIKGKFRVNQDALKKGREIQIHTAGWSEVLV
jgi:hypothetical protein